MQHVTDPEIRTLFMELRDEETQHVRLLEDAIANLPPSAKIELYFYEDESPAL